MKLLIIEDNLTLLRSLGAAFREESYAVDTADSGEAGLYKARNSTYDAILLDVMLPRMTGWEVLEQLRPGCRTPVLMLTARNAVADRVKGLNSGADDYMTKPFEIEELIARVQALTRRAAGLTHPVITIDTLRIDLSAKKVTLAGAPVPLTAKEYCLLEYLSMHRGEVISRTTLYEHLFDDGECSMSNLLDVHVSNLRKKLATDIITTRRGIGYCVE